MELHPDDPLAQREALHGGDRVAPQVPHAGPGEEGGRHLGHVGGGHHQVRRPGGVPSQRGEAGLAAATDRLRGEARGNRGDHLRTQADPDHRAAVTCGGLQRGRDGGQPGGHGR
nr:hypothetical protein [Geodermatophilus sp. LHW52908]